MLAAILHLGDIEFGEMAGEDNADNRATIIDTAPLHRGMIAVFNLLYFQRMKSKHNDSTL